jgi:HAMP domain-containing protein
VPRVTQIPDQQNSISRDEVRELGASVKELVSQLRVLTWNLTSMS